MDDFVKMHRHIEDLERYFEDFPEEGKEYQTGAAAALLAMKSWVEMQVEKRRGK